MKRVVRFGVLRLTWCVGLCMLSALSAWGQTPEQAPLVKKKLFVPMTEAGPGSTGPQAPAVDGRFVLTGVMVGPDGKKALIQIKGDPAVARDGSAKGWRGEGESVGGYLVESIEPNAVILTGNNQKVRVPLYGTPKERPQPLTTASAGKKELSRPDHAAGSKGPSQGPQGSAGGGGASKNPSNAPPQASSAGPLGHTAEAMQQGSQENTQGTSAGASAPGGFMNPFAEALRKAQEAQRELSQPSAGGAPAGPPQ